MPSVLAVSPHLDDVAFSCGGVLGTLRRRGWEVRVATVFTATVEPLSPFALACQLDKGLDADVDYMALRRNEDVDAMGCLGVADVRHLDLAEAPHRGYDSAADLFSGVHPGDDVQAAVRDALEPLVAGVDLVLGPTGLGNHVDHLLVAAALDELDVPLLRYRDTPYALRLDVEEQAAKEVAVDVTDGLDDKVAACACYVSQLGFQFGGAMAMGRALHGFAGAEARRCGQPGVAEVLSGPADVRSCLG